MITPRRAVLYDLLYFLELRYAIRGYIAVNQRHDIKHKIFFDILIERAEKSGKWNSLSTAVQDVYVEVTEKFAGIDEQYIEKQLKKVEEKKQIASTEEEGLKNIKARNTQGRMIDEILNDAEKRRSEIAKELQGLEMKMVKYTEAKKNGYPFECLGREILFNSDIELSLINCLRDNKEIMTQVIAKRDKLEPKE